MKRARWVVKGAAEAREPKARAMDEASPGLPSLEQFKAEWPEPPDETSLSNKDYYFNSYAHFGIHEDMLKDEVRTGSYMKAILHSPSVFEGKTVLDVGSGTGILSLFAAKAGAKRCIGIECSDIVGYARQIAERNGYGDKITYVQGKVEEVELPVDEVDIIVSEWMGYFMIFESMLDSVLFARDKWLRKGGHLFPDHARLYLAAIEDADYREEKLGFWSHMWGLDFSPVQKLAMQEPITDTVEQASIATSVACVSELDLTTCRREDLDFFARFNLSVKRKDFIHAFVVWFDVTFRASTPPIVMTTAPGQPTTHWKQTVLYLEEPIVADKGDSISGLMAVRKNAQNPRDLDVKVSINFEGAVAYAPKVQWFRVR